MKKVADRGGAAAFGPASRSEIGLALVRSSRVWSSRVWSPRIGSALRTRTRQASVDRASFGRRAFGQPGFNRPRVSRRKALLLLWGCLLSFGDLVGHPFGYAVSL